MHYACPLCWNRFRGRKDPDRPVIEQDGERLAVPAGEKPEHEKGDEITATRTPEGFETGKAYGYGR